MTFPILGGNGAVATYSIDNSLRFEDGDTAYLSKSSSGSTGAGKTFTLSLWVKRGELGREQYLVHARSADSQGNFARLEFDSGDGLRFRGYSTTYFDTSRLFRDTSAWYHLVLAVDTDTSGDSNSVKIYVNGVQETAFDSSTNPSTDDDLILGSNRNHFIGTSNYAGGTGALYNGYMAEIHLVDGQQLDASSFGEFDEDSGIWKPIQYSGSYGTNGFYLDFENSGSLGADQSGNGNNFTPTNLASTDQMIDTPTNNFATMNAVSQGTLATLSEGNLKYTNPSVNSGDLVRVSTQAFSTGKWYAEFYRVGGNLIVGIQKSDYDNLNKKLGEDAEGYGFFVDGRKVNNNTFTSYGSAWSVGDVVGIVYDADLGTLAFYVNGVSQGNAFTGLSGEFVFATGNNSTSATNGIFNFGQDSSFAGNETRQNNSDGNGKGDFYYTPPTGYLSLCTSNLATVLSPTIDDGSQYFHTQLYTGNGVDDTAITNDAYSGDFQPDFLWIKERSSTSAHRIFDSSRGASIRLEPNATLAEATDTSNHKSFDTDGFTLGTSGSTNANGDTYVAWQLKANAGSTSSNTSGSITSTVQANTTAGFSIVTYTGTQANATVGHGLGKVPAMLIIKCRDASAGWQVFHKGNTSAPETELFRLNETSATADNTLPWNDTYPTSTVFTIGANDENNKSGDSHVAYCFAEIEGYSKFGSYTGNGSTDGTFVYTGFRPSWVMVKRTDSTGNWVIYDSKRNGFNVDNDVLLADRSDGEFDVEQIDLLSNGLKFRSTSNSSNSSGGTYIYACFSANPFVSSTGIPVTAR